MSETTRIPRRRPNPRFRAAVRRIGLLYAVLLGVALAVVALYEVVYLAYLHALDTYGTPIPGYFAHSFDVESFLPPVVFAAAFLWQLCFFDGEICHGVSRRSFSLLSTVGGLLGAVVPASLVVPAVWDGTVRGASDPSLTGWMQGGLSLGYPYRFLLGWTRYNPDNIQYDPQTNTFTETGEWLKSSPQLAHGWWYVFLVFLALLIAASALGMLAGAVADRMISGGPVRAAVIVAALLLAGVVAGNLSLGWADNHVARPDWKTTPIPTWLYLLRGAVVGYEPDGTEVTRFVSWIPLAFALALFAVSALIVWRLTMRREVRPVRFASGPIPSFGSRGRDARGKVARTTVRAAGFGGDRHE